MEKGRIKGMEERRRKEEKGMGLLLASFFVLLFSFFAFASDANASLIPATISKTTTEASATITWQTTEPVSTWIVYGTDLAYGGEYRAEGSRREHSATLSELQANTTYYFHIRTGTGKTLAPYSTFYTGQITDVAALQQRILELTQLLQTLQAQVLARSTGDSSQAQNDRGVILNASEGSLVLDRNLRLGDTGEDVRALQRFLNSRGILVATSGAGSPGQETTYFGPATRAAVIRFQEANKETVLVPAGLSRGTGFVGALTRTRINTDSKQISTDDGLARSGVSSGGESLGGGGSSSRSSGGGGGAGDSVSSGDQSQDAASGSSQSLASGGTFTSAGSASAGGATQSSNSPPANTSSASPGVATSRTSISQHGITWTFDKVYPTGQFANGDWWVIGPVKITSITPHSRDINGRIVNGSMVNPKAGVVDQGYDSSMYAQYDRGYYKANLNVAFGVSAVNPLIVANNSSLISTITETRAAGARPQIEVAAVLTVLPSAPPAGSFRPPYAGTDKAIKFNKNQLRLSLLPKLTPTANAPSLASVEARFEKPWIDHGRNWLSRYMHPTQSFAEYGRDFAAEIGEGSLMLLTSVPNKETLAIRFVQHGIDFVGNVAAGRIFNANGGHDQGRLWPIIFSGLLLGDANMTSAGSWYKTHAAGEDLFQDQGQHWIVTQADVGRPLPRADTRNPVELYTQAHVGLPEWGIRHFFDPGQDNAHEDATYRDIVGQSLVSHILSAYLLGAEQLWGDPAIPAYGDRWWSWNGKGPKKALSQFARTMWPAYRASAPVSTALITGVAPASTAPAQTAAAQPAQTTTTTTTTQPAQTSNNDSSGTTAPADPSPVGGLVAHYSFDGNAADSQGAFSGVIVGGTSFVAGKSGQAASFDGLNDGISLGSRSLADLGITDAFSVAVWARTSDVARGGQTIFAKGSANSSATYSAIEFQMVATSPRPRLRVSDGGSFTSIGSATNVSANTWYHLAVTFDAARGTATLYQDGAVVRTESFAPIVIADSTLVRDLGIGYDPRNKRAYFQGELDELRIYDRVLTAGEIQSLYQGGSVLGASTSATDQDLAAYLAYLESVVRALGRQLGL